MGISTIDHPIDIKKLLEPGKPLIAPPDCLKDLQQYDCHAIKPAQTLKFNDWSVTGIAAYNPDKQFHPKNNYHELPGCRPGGAKDQTKACGSNSFW